MEMKEGTSIDEHLKQMKEITDKLASIGSPISEEDQVVTLLGSLPPSYSTLVRALEARADDIRLDFVQQALNHEEQMQKGLFGQPSDTSSTSQKDSALVGVEKKGLSLESHQLVGTVVKWDTSGAIVPKKGVHDHSMRPRLRRRYLQNPVVKEHSQHPMIHLRWTSGW